MEYILQKSCKLILYLLGWKTTIENPEMIKRYKNYNAVIAMSHTSQLDVIPFLLYKYAYPEIFSSFTVPIKPQVYDSLPKWIHKFLDGIGFIKATAYEMKNGGFVKAVVDVLKNKKDFKLMLSPKGKIVKSAWRSGYYAIAKEMNCDIMAAGLDYEKKKIVFFEPISIKDKSKDEVEKILQTQLSEIIPLNIEYSEFPLRKHNKNNVAIFVFSFAIIGVLLYMFYLYRKYWLLFIGVLILFIILL